MFSIFKVATVCAAACLCAIQATAFGATTDKTTQPISQQLAQSIAAAPGGEAGANALKLPHQILRTGINLSTTGLSANSKQLSDIIKLTPVLEQIEALRNQIPAAGSPVTMEGLTAKQELLDATIHAQQIIQQADLAVDYSVAEINAEQSVYNELLTTFTAQANRSVQRANWASYYSNGALWAVAEALDIPTWKRPKYSISSGINGIIAGVIPSAASLWSMHAASGPHKLTEKDPNMLTALFGIAAPPEVQYPQSVWQFLATCPAGDKSGKLRKDQLIDRWVADANIPGFTDRSSQQQIDLVTANVDRQKALTIDLLQTRNTMLSQLSAEILKMKRMLYELSLAVSGEKHVQVAETNAIRM